MISNSQFIDICTHYCSYRANTQKSRSIPLSTYTALWLTQCCITTAQWSEKQLINTAVREMSSAVEPTHSTLFKRLQRGSECASSDPSISTLIGLLHAF